jgi:hypothetical protein
MRADATLTGSLLPIQRKLATGSVNGRVAGESMRTAAVPVLRSSPKGVANCACSDCTARPVVQRVASLSGRPLTATASFDPRAKHEEGAERCGDKLGTCDFYLCRERQHPCGSAGYYQGYGYKYCQRFTALAGKTTPAGKRWALATLRCLQEHIEANIPIGAPCSEVWKSAFDSHPNCYFVSGICSLTPTEWWQIMGTIDSSDLDMKQALRTALMCAGNWTNMPTFQLPVQPPSH